MIKDRIKRIDQPGEWLSVTDLENRLASNPAVAAAAVSALPMRNGRAPNGTECTLKPPVMPHKKDIQAHYKRNWKGEITSGAIPGKYTL